MRLFLFLLGLLGVGLGSPRWARAQQTLCEKGFGAYQASVPYSGLYTGGLLISTAPDSCLLPVYQPAAGDVTQAGTRARLVWLSRNSCDTARFASLPTGRWLPNPVAVVRRRRGDLLVAATRIAQTAIDTSRTLLCSYSRQGGLRWSRSLAGRFGIVRSLLEAPDRGAYLTNIQPALYKVDSLGRVQWLRRYCQGRAQIFDFGRPAYTVRGNLLLAGSYGDPTREGLLLLEVSQHGDSLTSRFLPPPYAGRGMVMLGLRPLRDGGFLLTAQLDSTLGNGSRRNLPYLVRLDANLNVQWRYVYRSQLLDWKGDASQGGYELADSSLLLACAMGSTNTNSGALRFLRLSASGALLNTYAYQSSHPAAYGTNEWLTPLAADSSFVLVGGSTTPYGTYVDRFRLPGLRRVLAEPALPAVQVLAVRPPARAAFPAPAYPNPARELVTVPLPAGAGAGRLCLLDLAGRLVRSQPTAAGAGPATLSVAGLAPGVYVLRYEQPGQPPATQRLAVGP